MPSLSVAAVVPCYNNAPLIPEALATIRAQTREVQETIVVDDGSSDDSAAIAERLGARVIRLGRNRGPSAARNAGIRAATTDLVAFLDADDLWLPDHVERAASALENSPSAAITFAAWQHIDEPPVLEMKVPSEPDVPFDALASLLLHNYVPQSTAVARRKVLLDVGGYDERVRYAEDYRLWLAIARDHKFVYDVATTTLRRRHSGQSTHNDAQLRADSWTARADALARDYLPRGTSARATVEAASLVALREELKTLWMGRDREGLLAVLRAARDFPRAQPIVRRWRWSERLLWWPWMAVTSPLSRLPVGLRTWIREAVGSIVYGARPSHF